MSGGADGTANRSADVRRFRAMLVKETRQILRDPSTFLIAFVMPVMLMVLMGFGVNLDASRTRVGLAMEDDSAAAQSLAGAFQNSNNFAVVRTGGVPELRAALVAGEIRAIVVIPSGFGSDLAKGGGIGRGADIQIVTDGAMPNNAAFVAGHAQGVHARWLTARAEDGGRGGAERGAPIATSSRFWFNPGLASRYFLVPGSIAVVMAMIGSLLTALVVAREWERGTLEGLMATPIGMSEFLLTKVIPYMGLGLVSMSLCTVMAVFLFDVPLRGSVFALLAISVVYLIPALGQGLLISAGLKNQFVASQVALLTAFMPTMLLSNFIFEIASMPWPIQAISYVVPARYLIPQLNTVFVAGDDWSLFLPNMAVLLGFGAVLFALCRLVTKRRIA